MAAEERDTVTLMGVAIDRLTQRETVDRVIDELDSERGGWITTPNLDQLRIASRSPQVRDLLAQADVSVADGMPLVWASTLLGDRLPERVPGSDLIWTLTAAVARRGGDVHLIGGAGNAGGTAAEILAAQSPALRTCAHLPLPMNFDPASAQDVNGVRDALRSTKPALVFVGLGFPKQERLIAAIRADFPHTWFVGVGISFSFVSGEIRRAPPWMHALGVEWVHRLIQEPQRLGRRYLLYGLPFALRLAGHVITRRLAALRSSPRARAT
jgi:N-acetylglucosaminyldiphosphoundecaprenol N-acetyl-beta-D-mannosaminyltransferase